jgi:hypothetical protein
MRKGAIAIPAASAIKNRTGKTPCPVILSDPDPESAAADEGDGESKDLLLVFLAKRVGNHRIRVVFAKNFK